MTGGSKRWFRGGAKLPPKLALLFALLFGLVAAGWLLLALDGGLAAWKGWVLAGVVAVSLIQAAYYALLYRSRRR